MFVLALQKDSVRGQTSGHEQFFLSAFLGAWCTLKEYTVWFGCIQKKTPTYKPKRVIVKTFIMLHPSWSCSSNRITLMHANNHLAIRSQTIWFFQPRFGNIDINWRNSRWLHRDKGHPGNYFILHVCIAKYFDWTVLVHTECLYWEATDNFWRSL